MFQPNININIADVVEMGGERVKGIDVDMYEFKRDDTTITVSFDMDSNSTFLNYEWRVPIPDSIPDTLFLNEISNKYRVTFCHKKKLAYCSTSRLIFLYSIENIEEDPPKNNRRYFILSYDPWLMLFHL